MKTKNKYRNLFYLALFIIAIGFSTPIFAQTLCPQVSELSDDGSTKTYDYEYGASVASEYADDRYWLDQTDGYNLLYLNSVHVFDELENGVFGQPYASWHMTVAPFYMPEECEGMDPTDLEDCFLDNFDPLTGFWSIYADDLTRLYTVEWDTFLPGPYATEDLCEWYSVEELERDQLVEYENFVIWDWDAFCYEEGSAEYDDLCASYATTGECFEARGCADGVFVNFYESDEGWFDDFASYFYVFREVEGEVERSRSDLVDMVFYNQLDKDSDGLSDTAELSAGTDPDDSDSDDDGLNDGDEVNSYETDPLDSDSDDEGLLDGEEVLTYNTDPNNSDTDGDSLDDKIEVDNELNPNDANDATTDDDGDGLANADEILIYDTDLHDSDSDDDSLSDGDEVNIYLTNPLDDDTDSDDLEDNQEILMGADPNDTDSDDDGLTDGSEVYTHTTSPTDSDSDDDGLNDGDEVNIYGSNPNDDDSDNDGLSDGDEVSVYNSDPVSSDSDGDSLADGDEVSDYGTNPADNDTDDEGLFDGEEVLTYNTDPLDEDSDDDEWSDYEEVNAAITKDPLKFDNLIAQTFQHDFNGDGFSDLLAFYPDGEFYVILSDGDEFVDSGFWISGLGDYTSIPFTGDFNNDGKDDVAVMNPEDGRVQAGLSDGSSFSSDGTWSSGYDENSTREFVGDFDGDGFSDILTFDSDAGEVFVSLANGSSFDSETKWITSFGYDSSFQFVGEFDGNDQTDFIAYQSDGTFEVATSLGDSFDDQGTRGNSFPTTTTQMAAGDFNGDCLIDVVGMTVSTESPSWQTSTWDVFASNGTSFIDDGTWAISESMSSTGSGCAESTSSDGSNDSGSSTGSGKYPLQQFIPIKIIDVIQNNDDDEKTWTIKKPNELFQFQRGNQ